MEFRILGPLEVRDGDRLIEVPGAKVRALLVFLVLNPNQVVSADRLIEALWGETPPPTAANTLQTHMSHLRKALAHRDPGGEATQVVVTRSPGYVLAVDADLIDARRFEQLAQEGRRALAAAEPEQALSLIAEALSLWRGPALVDFAFEPFASSEVARLEELRIGAVADRIEAELALGRHGDLTGELRQLVEEHPLRERLWGQLMLALYRSGRQADALRAYSELRKLLGEELGIEPSQDLQRLEEAMLLQKPDLDWAPAEEPVQTSQRAVAAAPPHNLPPQLTSFVGRTAELRQIAAAFSRARHVTLCGPGGVGKTRLALAAAAEVLEREGDGVFVVELAGLADPSLVVTQTLSVLGAGEEPRPPLETLVHHVGDRRLLLVLDNCEHVLAACATLADTLLRGCPEVRLLATSREPLHTTAETSITVPPLPVPDAEVIPSVEVVTEYDSVQLFLARARSVRPDFEISDATAPGVARVCQRLDGMPLALELAAARIRAMSPGEISERLDDRFRLLTGGTRTGPARHQTLRAAIDWTYDALSGTERIVFNRLSAFTGGFTLEDAEEVCGFPPVNQSDVMDVLFTLVDKSLVVADTHPGRTRYGILETLRHFGAERLVESGQQDDIYDRLLQWALDLAETAESNLDGRDQGKWLERLEVEHDNIRAALSWGVAPDRAVAALALAAALWRFWEVRGHLTEGRRWLERLLALPADVPPVLRAKALNSAAVLAQRQSAYETAKRLYEESLAIRRELGDRRGVAAALHGLGNLAGLQGDFRSGLALFEESLAIGRAVGEPRVVAASLTNLGWMAQQQGDLPTARQHLQESLEIYTELRDGHGAANVLHRLGAVAECEGDWAAARSLYKESLRLQRELGERYGVVWSLSSLADVLEAEGDAEAAHGLLEDVLALARELGNKYCETITLARLARRAWSADELDRAGHLFQQAISTAVRLGDNSTVAECLKGLAGVARAQGDPIRAARLLGAAQSIAAATATVHPGDAPEDDDLAELRQELGEGRFLAAWMAGRSMDAEQAARYVSEGGGRASE